MLLSPAIGSRVKVVTACTICAFAGCMEMTLVAKESALLQPARLLLIVSVASVAFQVFAYGRSLGYDWRIGPLAKRFEMALRCSVMTVILGLLSIAAGGISSFFLLRFLWSS